MAGGLRFGLLGPISVHVDGVERTPSRGRLRDLLGLLLAHAGTPVPSSSLISALYGGTPPPTAVTALQVHVSQLRKVLDPGVPARAPEQRLRTVPGAYLLRVDEGELDVARFVALADRGAAALRDGRPAGATLRAALGQWRGEHAAEGAGVPALTDEFATWAQERRLAVLELCLDAETAEGALGDQLAELRGLVAAHELHEGFSHRLALALYRAGRQADALGELQAVRHRLAVAGCGRPAEPLRRLQERILAADPHLLLPRADAVVAVPAPRGGGTPPPTPGPATRVPHADPHPSGRPAQLPARRGRLHGRDEAVARLVAVLGTGGPAVVTGAAGAGTTSVAVAAAHAAGARYPGGQLFARTGCGSGPGPVLRGFLSDLEVPDPGPHEPLARLIGRLRAELRGRDVLVVLDDVTTAHRPLLDDLAATPGVGLLATASRPLGVGTAVRLGPLAPAAATALLAEGAGTGRVEADPASTSAVLERCGHLPLAVRIAAGLLAARPHWPVRLLARRLAVPGAGLDELVVGDLTLRGSLLRRYRGCPRASRRAFRMLGAFGPCSVAVGLHTVGALLDAGPTAGAAAATALIDSGLAYRDGDALRLEPLAAPLAVALLDDAGRTERVQAGVVAGRERRRVDDAVPA